MREYRDVGFGCVYVRRISTNKDSIAFVHAMYVCAHYCVAVGILLLTPDHACVSYNISNKNIDNKDNSSGRRRRSLERAWPQKQRFCLVHVHGVDDDAYKSSKVDLYGMKTPYGSIRSHASGP